MKHKKGDIQTDEAIVAMSAVEIKALKIIVEKTIIDSNRLIDIKALCLLHDKLDRAENSFIPF